MNNSTEANNATKDFPPECPSSFQSPALEWMKIIVYLVILFLALFGNALVMRIVYKHRRMQTATNYLIVNMAVGDFLMAIFSMIPTAISMLRGTHAWVNDGPFGQISCKFFQFAQGSSMACSIITLTALAFERYFAVVFPMWKVVTIKKTIWMVVLIWIASFASTSPIIYAAKVRVFYGVPYCIEDWAPAFDPKRASAIYTIVSFVLLYALPLLLISVLYSFIIVKVWGRHIPGNTTPANVRLLNKSKKNVLKMLITVVLAFALCWFLMHLNIFLLDFSDVFPAHCGLPVGLQTTGFLFGHANSAINCCIYVIFSQDFRHGFKNIVRPLFPKRSTLRLENTRCTTMETTRGTHKRSLQPQSFKAIKDTSI